MIRLYRIVGIAFGLMLLAGNVASQEAVENAPHQQKSTSEIEQQSQEKKTDPIDYLPSLEGIEGAIRDLIAEEDKIAKKAQIARESRDLKAQEDMAKWAKLMFFSAALTTILTAIALWTIIKTLSHTRRAAVAAEKMAVDTKEIGNKQIQPQIFCSYLEAILHGNRRKLVFKIENSGATAGKDLWVNYSLYFFNAKNERIKQIVPAGGGNKIGSLFPKQELTGKSALMSWPEYKTVHAKVEIRYRNPNTNQEISDTFLFIGVWTASEFELSGVIE